jgi:hypothetical protein
MSLPTNLEPVTKDLEGIPDSYEPASSSTGQQADGAKPSKNAKQKMIAVLTSGGDSAGMNAAGMSLHPLHTFS